MNGQGLLTDECGGQCCSVVMRMVSSLLIDRVFEMGFGEVIVLRQSI